MSIKKEILVYQNLPANKYRWIVYMSYMQAVFLIANFWMMPSPSMKEERDRIALERVKQNKSQKFASPEDGSETTTTMPGVIAQEEVSLFDIFKDFKMRDLISWRNLVQNLHEKPGQALAFTGGSVAIITSLWFYTSRLAHKIILLPNDRARFLFFSSLPIKHGTVVEMDLKNIACIAPRNSKHNYSILKFRNSLGYRLVDKKEGQFLEPKLYDEYLGFQRSWYKE